MKATLPDGTITRITRPSFFAKKGRGWIVQWLAVFLVIGEASRSTWAGLPEDEAASRMARAVFNSIVAAHAAPVLSSGVALQPYRGADGTGLPTPETTATYLADPPEDGIYWMQPPENLPPNRLAKVSTGGPDALTSADWAYAGQTQDVDFFPASTPQWIDFTDPVTGLVTGRVAYAVWDESGKFDLNLAGADEAINGLAPHALGFEQLANDPSQLLAFLNGPNGARDRSNFSARRIADGMGDDRRFFNVREIFQSGLTIPADKFDVAATSQDYDVRSEWDGDPGRLAATKYLRTYLNSPSFFSFFISSSASSRLVMATLDEQQWRARLFQENVLESDDALHAMRLLASLRLSLPPFRNLASSLPLPANLWTDDDVWGIALNLVQAAETVSDQNHVAYDRRGFGLTGFNDPNARIGIRASPYITETAIKLKRLNASQIQLTQYYEIWNPYPFDLVNPDGTSASYYYGNWTGGSWNQSSQTTGGIYSPTSRWLLPVPADDPWNAGKTVPGPGQFVTVQLPPRVVGWSISQSGSQGFSIRTRPYIQNADYWSSLRVGTGGGVEESSSYSVSIGTFYTGGGSNPSNNLVHRFPPGATDQKISPTEYLPVWHSFQIDDPRMGPFARYTANWQSSVEDTPMTYSWKRFYNTHSLHGIADGPDQLIPAKRTSPYGDGYNQNFGENWPPGFDFAKAMATFSIPGRPFQNPGELGTVFANRPWRTLSLAATTVPTDPSVWTGTTTASYPTRWLDLLSTLGTTTASRALNYKLPAPTPQSSFVPENYAARVQSAAWLFEQPSFETPQGAVRPIRGRINLNSASEATIARLLSAPYRMAPFPGIASLNPTPIPGSPDQYVTIAPQDALTLAQELTRPAGQPGAVRPLRSMADLGKLPSLPALHLTYPDPVADAIVGRLAQFGTLRQQMFTIDVAGQLFDPQNPGVVTAESRLRATVHFDTFTRRATLASIDLGASLAVAADGPGLAWKTGGVRPWVGQFQPTSYPVEPTHDGEDALRSGPLNPGEQSWVEATVQGPGTLTFWRSMKGSPGRLELRRDNILLTNEAGGQPWEQRTYGVPGGAHTFRWTYQATDSLEEGEGARLDEVRLIPAGPAYLAWAQQHFSGEEIATDPDTTPTGDFNADGVRNLAHFGFDQNPRQFSEALQPSPTVVTDDGVDYLAVQYLRRTDTDELTYQVETGPVAGNLSAGGLEMTTAPGPTPNTERVTARDTVPISSTPQRAMRVRIQASAPN